MKKVGFTLVVLCILASCKPMMYPFYLENVESIVTTKRIAIMPCNLFFENKYSKSHSVKVSVEDSLRAELQRMGFEVVSQAEMNKDVDSIMSTYGAFYQPKTGELDTVLLRDFRTKTIQHACAKYKVTSVLFPYIRMTKVYIDRSGYNWDGRYIYSTDIGNVTGSTTGLSLYVRIYDQNAKMIFDNAGGIQPLVNVKSHNRSVAFRDDEILKDPAELSTAVKIVFKPIVERPSK